jgi:hypothetical protein
MRKSIPEMTQYPMMTGIRLPILSELTLYAATTIKLVHLGRQLEVFA